VNLNSQFTEIPPGSGKFRQTTPPTLFGTITVASDVFSNGTGVLEFSVKDQVADGPMLMQIDSGTNISTPEGVGLRFLTLGVNINNTTLQAGNGISLADTLEVRAAARNITITGSTLSGNAVTIAGGTLGGGTQKIALDSMKVSGPSGVTVGLPTVRTGITIRNSSELAALAAAITINSKGGPITVTDSVLHNAKSIYIDGMDPDDTTASGVVTLRSVQLSADAIRARGFSPSGDALIIDGSTLNAAQFIKLYAEGASTLRFRNNVSLNTAIAVLAGKTVEVDTGGSVNITGKGRIFTDNDNYNKAGFGTISAGGGLTKGGYNSREAFGAAPGP
jgi:hypothetical protein